MPVWKCALLAFLAIPRYACAEGDSDPEQKVEELPTDDTDESLADSLRPEQLQKMHSKMDADNNGKVSLNELLEFSHATRKHIAAKDIKTVFDEMDSDKDGKISLVELFNDIDKMAEHDDKGEHDDKDEASRRKAVEEEKFKAADADGDGFLSKVELPALFYPELHEGVLQIAAQSTLAEKDKDKDGLLTEKEFWEDHVEGELVGEATTDFRKLDKDGSGTLDLEELKAWESGHFHTTEALQKLVEAADKDHDLHLTSDEMAAAHSTIAGSDAHYHFMEWAEHHEL
mmetsp:Transcript_131760/g.262926  ORF Transcript_131760/g.262926 Transcript_131760/m.262926 type:complete len:286 (-) Transcript_131760:293-1150(-)